MTPGPLAVVPLALALVTGAVAQPDPYRRTEQPWIGPAPIPVMEQVFWLQLEIDPSVELQVHAPEGVRLLDKTRPGPGRSFTRLYFRAAGGVQDGQILVTPAGGQALAVPLTVRTYRQDIEEQIKEVLGIDPAARKRGRSYYTDDLLAIAGRNLQTHPEMADRLKAPTVFDGMSDEELFAYLPSWNLPRQCYSNWPCPDCGETIFQKDAFYPWQLSSEQRFKCKCPSCGGLFPSNDITRDDFTGGDHPDDGWGYGFGDGSRNAHAGWVANYNHQRLWRQAGGQAQRLGERYLLLGDGQAAHAVGVLLCRMAYIYPGMDTRWQQVRGDYLRSGRLLLDGNWERTQILVPFCQAYDAVFGYLDRDRALVDFLATKDPTIKTPADVKALIDTYLIQVFGCDWLARRLSGGNMGARERDLAYMAVCADMGEVSDRWIEELFTHAYSSGMNKGGFDDETLINTSSREGIPLIAAFGYAQGYLPSKSDMAEILQRVTSPRWQARCNLYDEKLYPKFRAEFDTWPQMLVAGQHVPCYGDDGDATGRKMPKGAVTGLQRPYARAYGHWPTDAIARALQATGRFAPELFEPDVWPEVAAHAEELGPAPPLRSRVLDGVGFVFLESRPEAPDVAQRAGVALRYGYGRGHAHHDNLNIDLFAHDTSVTPELGYPCWAHPLGDTAHTIHHNTVMVDGRAQYDGAISKGTLQAFAAAPEASFAELSADPGAYGCSVYRRALCLADAPDGNAYLVDIFRVAGGTERTFCTHGPACSGMDSNLQFGEPGEPYAVTRAGRGLIPNVLDTRLAHSDGDVWADWQHQSADTNLRLHVLGAPGRRYLAARYGKPDAPPIRFFLPEEEAEAAGSEFVAVWEPYSSERFVESIRRLPVEGAADAHGFSPVALRVALAGGQVDTFIYTGDPAATVRCGDLELRGRFGYWSERDGRPRCAHLVDGTRLTRGDVGVTDVAPAFRAEVTAVELTDHRLALDRPMPEGDRETGRLLYLRGGRHRTAYHLAEVSADGLRVRLDLNGILFRSKIESVAPDGSHLECELPPSLEASGGFAPGYYDDALLTNEDLTARYRVSRIEGTRIYADRPLDPMDFADRNGDGRPVVCIYDIGPGDELSTCPAAFRVLSEDDG